LLVLVLGLASAVVWLLTRLSLSGRTLAVTQTELEREREGHAQHRERVEALTHALASAHEKSNTLENRTIELDGLLVAARERHAQDLAHMQGVLRTQESQFKKDQQSHELLIEQKFKALASDVLAHSQKTLLESAKQQFATEQERAAGTLARQAGEVQKMIAPISDSLKRTDEKLGAIEKSWTNDRAKLEEHLRSLGQAGEVLRGETAKLTRALREPHVRGRYGEIQLKRVAELAGMVEYCDFSTQETTRIATDDEGAQRPDMIVKLPSGRCIVIDAKTNIQAYLDAQEATTADDASMHLDRFARHVAEQAAALSKKRYWSSVEGSPEFVVMFLAHDAFLDAALAKRPDLLDHAASNNVILATPATLIGMLRARSCTSGPRTPSRTRRCWASPSTPPSRSTTPSWAAINPS
jgi:DNA recombination protein RmuC